MNIQTSTLTNQDEEGPSWIIRARFETFEEADAERVTLLEEGNLQVKVHWLRSAEHKVFAVKTRLDPNVAKREEKKRRKAKLSKKRRKK